MEVQWQQLKSQLVQLPLCTISVCSVLLSFFILEKVQIFPVQGWCFSGDSNLAHFHGFRLEI